MDHRENYILASRDVEKLTRHVLESIIELVRVILNNVKRAEGLQYMQAKPYKHIEFRKGDANGYILRMVSTRLGDITFVI